MAHTLTIVESIWPMLQNVSKTLVYTVFPPKEWYDGVPLYFSLAPPSFNFKVYAEKHCFITWIEHC